MKKYRKAAALSTSFTFYVAFRATGIPVKLCNRGVLNRDFSADSGTQCLLIYLLSFNTVGQGRLCFSLKLLTNNYKLNVFGNILVHPDLKDFKSLFITGEFLVALLSFNV